jgi:hypothetical protein
MNDRQMSYRRLPVELFTDTLEAGTLSHRHHNGWVRAMPIVKAFFYVVLVPIHRQMLANKF